MASPAPSNVRRFTTQDAKEYHRGYPGAFSATDIYAVLALPGGEVRILGSLAALSISTHRDSFPVTAMSYVNPRGFTQGHRIIAGTLIFHTIDRAAFLLPSYRGHRHLTVNGGVGGKPALMDELPLFDIHVNYVNEHGMASFEAIYGIRLIDFGKTISLESLHPVESYSYMATDYQPMAPLFDEAPKPDTFILRSPDRTSISWLDAVNDEAKKLIPEQVGLDDTLGNTPIKSRK